MAKLGQNNQTYQQSQEANNVLNDVNQNITGQTESLSNIDTNTAETNNVLNDINQNVTGQTESLSNIDTNTAETNGLLQSLNNTLSGTTLSTTASIDIPTDAIGSLQVSQKASLGSYVMDKNQLDNIISRVSVSATQTYTGGTVIMDVGVGGYAIAQTFNRHPYYAGKSHRPEFTFEDLIPETDVIKRAGYYSSTYSAPYDTGLDGFFLESDGTEVKIGIANADTSNVTYIPQSSWNLDKLDGTGDSGITIDWGAFIICICDFLYLGGSAVRFGFKLGNSFVWAHAYEHSNVKSGTIVSSPSQPLRWEIRSNGGTGSLKQICGDVSTEGTLDVVGIPASTIVQSNPVNANSTGVNYALAGLRLTNTSSGHKTAILNTLVSYLVTTNDEAVVELFLNPTIAGTLNWTPLPSHTDVEYLDVNTGSPSTNTVTGGLLLYASFVNQNNGSVVSDVLSIVRRLGHAINGTPDELILTVRPLSGGANTDAYGIINFNVY